MPQSRHPLVDALARPVELFLDPSERLYWVYLLGSVALAALVWLLARVRGGPPRIVGESGLRNVVRRAFSSSALVDYQLLLVVPVLRAALLLPLGITTLGLTGWLATQLDRFVPLEPIRGWSPTAVAIVYTVVLFLVWDFSRFALHWAAHRFRFLWAFHKVHHSAETMNPITLHRVHPVEAALFRLRGVLTTACVAAIFFHLFRGQITQVELAGINLFGFAFNFLGANLRHTHVWVSYGSRLERWVISPAQHQIHHGTRPEEMHSNLGSFLAIWDRMAGTLRVAAHGPPQRFGLPDAVLNHDPHSLVSALWQPLVAAFRPWFAGGRVRKLGSGVATLLFWVAVRDVSAAPAEVASDAPSELIELEPHIRAGAPDDPNREPDPAEIAPETPQADLGTEAESPAAEEPGPGEGGAETPASPAGDASDPPPPDTAGAAAEPNDDGRNEQRRVVVMGSILGDSEEIPRVAGSAHVIDESELEAHEHDDVHRVLEAVPGVYVRGEDGFGLRPNIGLRGASSDRSAKLSLMEDGILMAPAPYSAPAAYYFPLITRMAAVEVFKGPASIRHGPNTIGGALNLRSRDIPTANSGFIDVAGGRFRYAKAHGWWGGTWKGFGVLLEAARVQTRGFKELDGEGDTGFGKTDLLAKVGYETPAGRQVGHRVVLKGGHTSELSHETYLGLSSQDFADTPYRRYAASQKGRMKWWRTQATLSYLVHKNERMELETRLYRHDFDRSWRKLNRFRDGPALADILANPDAGQSAVFFQILRGQEDSVGSEQALMIGTNARRYASQGAETIVRFRPKWRVVALHIEAGARIHNDWIHRTHTEDAHTMIAGTLVSEQSPVDTTTRNRAKSVAGAFYVQDSVTFVDRITISPGVRLELISGSFIDDLAGTDGVNRFDVVPLPGVGAYLQATSWLGVLAGLHAGFSPVSPGQPDDVQPERSINYEGGLRATWEGLHAEAIGFFNDYDNLTGECTLSAGCSDEQLNRQYNAGEVHVYGVESLLQYRHRFDRGFRLGGGGQYTYTGSYFRESFSSENPQFGEVEAGDELPYVPVHQGSANVVFGGNMWDLRLSLGYVGVMRDIPGRGEIVGDERVPAHAVLDIAGEIRVADRFRFYALGNNLLANEYIISRRPFGARPGPPLSVIVGVKVHFYGA